MSTAKLSLSDLEHFDDRAPSRGRERRFLCIECGADKPRDSAHRSLALNTGTGLFTCHRCNLHGKLTDFFEERPRLTRREFGRLQVSAAFNLQRPTRAEPKPGASEKVADTWARSEPIAGTPGASYLSGRSIPVELATAAGVRYLADYYGRPATIFPMRDRAGELVAVEGRYADGREDPKSRTTGQKSAGTFATPGAFEAPALVIVEGPVDALALAAAGLPALALCGKAWPAWLSKVCAFRPIILALDADTAGDLAAATLKAELERLGAHCLRLRPKGGKDWGELLERRGLDALRGALRGFSSEPLAGVPDEKAGVPGVEPLTNDDVRITEARRLARAGRLNEALFIARLLEGDLTWGLAVKRSLESTCRLTDNPMTHR